MIYSFSDTVPKNTPFSSRRRTVMQLTRGVIHKVEVQFPLGCAGLAKCCINDSLSQVWPSNTGVGFSGDGYVISFTESREVLIQPYTLDLWCWNESTDHEHTITVRLGILNKKDLVTYIVRGVADMILKRLK